MTPKEIPFQKKELKIKVSNPNTLPTIDFHQLSELQGDLKITTPQKIQKLKNSIIKYGVFVPKFVWIDKSAVMTKFYIEDGHQTKKALIELEKDGYHIPAIPFIKIDATDKKDAAEKLLMINSRFADINPSTTFFDDFDITPEFAGEIEIPELKLDFEELKEESKEISEEALNAEHKCPKCGYEW